jgi:hypothetical protein
MLSFYANKRHSTTATSCTARSSILIVLLLIFSSARRTTAFVPTSTTTPQRLHHRHTKELFFQNEADVVRQQWVEKSVNYYSKVMREERRRDLGQSSFDTSSLSLQLPQQQTLTAAAAAPVVSADQRDYLTLAKKHYFALVKVKDGKHHHAESIYRRIIDELMDEEDEECDHAKLAVTTLLLALHMQRSKDDGVSVKQARSVFLNFFRLVTMTSSAAGADQHAPCACSAKVLQAFALFEMKQGNELKSYMIVLKAIELDPELRPVLQWKQFRKAHDRFEKLMVHRKATTMSKPSLAP